MVLVIACHQSAMADEAAVRKLSASAQTMLSEMVPRVVDIRAMADKKTFDNVKVALDRLATQWPVETDSTEQYRACKNALERASYVAFLTRMKATSTLDDKVWALERGKMTDRHAACERVMRRSPTKKA